MKILVVDSVEVYLEGLRALLSPSFPLSAKLLQKNDFSLPGEKVDLLVYGLCDDNYPLNLKYAHQLKKNAKRTIAVLTADCLPFLPEIAKIGFDSYLHRFAPKEIALRAVKETARGSTFIDRKIAPWLWKLRKELPPEYHLSEREKQVVEHLLKGLSNKEIAVNLYVSVNTVKFHIQNIFCKLGVRNRFEFQTACHEWFDSFTSLKANDLPKRVGRTTQEL